MKFDVVIIGTGSAGCAVAASLAVKNVGTIAVLEAGPTDQVPQVKVPFGLLHTMGSSRDWKFKSAPQPNAHHRAYKVNRGFMVGGSSSINSMVWFRGRMDDYDAWGQPGWSGADMASIFDEVEARIEPQRLPDPHPLSEGFARGIPANRDAPPSPERESSGIFHTNMRRGRRWSAADAFLRPAVRNHSVKLITGANVDRIEFNSGVARKIHLMDGRVIEARAGIVLSAGSIGSPAILMRSGIGPRQHLNELDVKVIFTSERVGKNLHDHPVVGLHHAGKNSGYGLVWNQSLNWALSPLHWLARRRGRMTSNFVEAGAFFRASPVGSDGDDRPDCQVHFIPYMMGYNGKSITTGSDYFADVGVCRPVSRGALTLNSADAKVSPNIDLGIFKDERDVRTLVEGFKRLRQLLKDAPLGSYRATEVFPAQSVQSDAEVVEHIKNRSGTAYHPVGTLAMGNADCPVSNALQVHGVGGLWVADASIMPSITSANTNAPSMAIGYKAGKLISESLRSR